MKRTMNALLLIALFFFPFTSAAETVSSKSSLSASGACFLSGQDSDSLSASESVFLSGSGSGSVSDSLLVVFWNIENFFNPGNGFEESRHWNRRRFETKCNAVVKIIFKIADSRGGRLPDIIGLAEVEDADVLKKLIGLTPLRKLGYGIVHFDSPDKRGIDCALLYRKSTLTLRSAKAAHLFDENGNVLQTRDILLAVFDSLSVLVNHHPSKVGDNAGSRRNLAMERMKQLCDSIGGRWLATGDFNDDVWGERTSTGGTGAGVGVADAAAMGTIKYNGKWEKIDGYFSRGFRSCSETICDFPELLEKDRNFGGLKPRRTYIGPRYNKGISDHLPIAIVLHF